MVVNRVVVVTVVGIVVVDPLVFVVDPFVIIVNLVVDTVDPFVDADDSAADVVVDSVVVDELESTELDIFLIKTLK